jgi:3-hydroxybutyryl-CoA dehydrogenase
MWRGRSRPRRRRASGAFVLPTADGRRPTAIYTVAPMDIVSIGVVGAGTMGNGIAHVFAKAGYSVTLCDLKQEYIDRAIGFIAKNLEREVAKQKIAPEVKDKALARIKTCTDRTEFSGVDFVVEAASERFDVKREIFEDLDRYCRPEVILASNTSSISITKLAALTKRPEKVIGMHFFNPVPVMKLVEIIRGLATSQETCDTVRQLATKLEKTPVEVNDSPGFVSNRVLMPLINEAIFTVHEGIATPEAVDEVFKLGMAHPMGPLALADFIGLDVCLDIMRVLQSGFGDAKYRPCPLLVNLVAAGHLGRKTGRGFYAYDQEA